MTQLFPGPALNLFPGTLIKQLRGRAMQRTYISRLIGDGLTLATANRPAWVDMFSSALTRPKQLSGTITEKGPDGYWMGTLEVDAIQHATLIASSLVRYAPDADNYSRRNRIPDSRVTGLTDAVSLLNLPVRDGNGADWKTSAG